MADRWEESPVERAAFDAHQAGLALTVQQCGENLHSDEMFTAHAGQPPVEVQSATHGVPLPALDLGKPLPPPHGNG